MLKQLVSRYRRLWIIQAIINFSCFSLFCYSVLQLLEVSYQLPIILSLTLVGLFYIFFNNRYRSITESNFLEHINRNYQKYQESAQLLHSKSDSSLMSRLQRLQRDKIVELFQHDLKNNRFVDLRPKFGAVAPIIFLLFAAILNFYGQTVLTQFDTLFLNDSELNENIVENNNLENVILKPSIITSTIKITPPAYTNSSVQTARTLDFEAKESSLVSWKIEFSKKNLEYFYTATGSEPKSLKLSNGIFLVEDLIEQTKLYRFSYLDEGKLIDIDGIYTVSMIRDESPKINISQPKTSLVEIAKDADLLFKLQAQIKDDYGISDVKILASVAKGSGEAVKFRDKIFRFEKDTSFNNKNISNTRFQVERNYQKEWKLTDLEMEPGDEVYFSIHAIDNKRPIQQLTKSSSIIVRWLDEDQYELATEGIKIKFVPEYFRSQRQIIIETEKLIEDKKDLSAEIIEKTSADLGHSQNDLKQKYGQYLGDEFGEGQGSQFGLADGYHGGESMSSGEATAGVHSIDDEQEDEHAEENGEQHHHEDDLSEVAQQDLSGATELIEKFGHSHGTSEVGPLSNRDPKSWMKMAVNEMWQAELHLMMADPEAALPYEYNAYKYLKLARKADRVYAKRLGFEPPPVTEERRLSGELAEILQYDLSYKDQANEQADTILFKQVYGLLNQSFVLNTDSFSAKSWDQFSLLAKRFLELSKERSVLVKYAAISERVHMAKSFQLSNCNDCVSDLKQKLWQLIPTPVSRPNNWAKPHLLSNEVEQQYLKAKSAIEVIE